VQEFRLLAQCPASMLSCALNRLACLRLSPYYMPLPGGHWQRHADVLKP
jgi:hypothetical protein